MLTPFTHLPDLFWVGLIISTAVFAVVFRYRTVSSVLWAWEVRRFQNTLSNGWEKVSILRLAYWSVLYLCTLYSYTYPQVKGSLIRPRPTLLERQCTSGRKYHTFDAKTIGLDNQSYLCAYNLYHNRTLNRAEFLLNHRMFYYFLQLGWEKTKFYHFVRWVVVVYNDEHTLSIVLKAHALIVLQTLLFLQIVGPGLYPSTALLTVVVIVSGFLVAKYSKDFLIFWLKYGTKKRFLLHHHYFSCLKKSLPVRFAPTKEALETQVRKQRRLRSHLVDKVGEAIKTSEGYYWVTYPYTYEDLEVMFRAGTIGNYLYEKVLEVGSVSKRGLFTVERVLPHP